MKNDDAGLNSPETWDLTIIPIRYNFIRLDLQMAFGHFPDGFSFDGYNGVVNLERRIE